MQKIKQTKVSSLDPLLGHVYSCDDELPLLGEESIFDGLIYLSQPASKVIFIVGGSTSDISYNGSWLRKFSELVSPYDFSVVSAAVAGFTSFQELIRIARDSICIKPDIVISLSGINDLGFIQSPDLLHPFVHYYQKDYSITFWDVQQEIVDSHLIVKKAALVGLDQESTLNGLNLGPSFREPPYKFWLQNIKSSHAICSTYSASYLAFLQPTMGVGNYEMNDEEQEFFEMYTSSREHYQEHMEAFYSSLLGLNLPDFILDATRVFEGHSNCYQDPRHPNKKGCELLASFIFNTLIQRDLIFSNN